MDTGGEFHPDSRKLLQKLLARAAAGDLGDLSAAERRMAQQLLQSGPASPSSNVGGGADPSSGNINHGGAQVLEDMEDSDSDVQDDDAEQAPDTTFGQVAAEVRDITMLVSENHLLASP